MSAKLRAIVLLVSLVAAGTGCGGSGDGEDANIEKAVQASVVREADDGAFQVDSPIYLDASVGTPKVQDLRVHRRGEKVATVTGRVRAEVIVKPKLDKAAFLRVVPASGAAVAATRRFTVQAIKQADGWVVGEDGVGFEDSPRRELTSQEVEDARQSAVKAMKALLTFDGDARAYNRAQGGFYATKRATEADFNQPAFDPAPALDLKNKTGDPVWSRTNDGGKDDLYVGNVFPYPGDTSGAECSTELRSMRPSTVSGEVSGSPRAGLIEDKVLIRGQAVVRVSDWICRERKAFGGRGKPTREGPEEVTVEYLIAVSRHRFGSREWFISGADLDDESATDVRFGGGGPRLYDTGSGEIRVLASP